MLSIRAYIWRANEGICPHVARVRPLRLPGHRALAQPATTYISAACLIFMGIGQGVVALLWREWGAFEANVLANVDVILKYDNSQI